MSSSELKIYPSLLISELIKRIRCAISECELNEVHKMLIDRENSMEQELLSLVKDRDSLKEEVRLLERALSSSDVEKLAFGEMWQQSRRECEELNERNVKLIENQTLVSKREKGGDEWYIKGCEENSETAKSRVLIVLNKENHELKCKNLESERMVEEYKEKHKRLEMRFVQMYKEMEGLRQEKAAADQTVDGLRRRELEANQIVRNLKRQNFEAIQTIDELQLKKIESDKAAEFNKKMLQNLTRRITKVEEAFAIMLNVKVEDLANIAKGKENSAGVEEAKHVNLPDSKGKKEILGNGSALGGEYAGDENAIGMSHGVHSTSNSTGIGCSALLKKGGENYDLSSRRKVDGADEFQTSPGAQSSYPPPQGESDDQEHESKGLQGPDPILIIGNETRPDGSHCTSSPGANLGEKEKICEKSPSSSPTFDLNSSHLKRKRSSDGNNSGIIHTHQQKKRQIRESTHETDESLNNFLGKLNLRFDGTQQATLPPTSNQVIRRCEEKVGAVCDSYTNLPSFFNLSDVESTDSEDDTCSDSDLNEMVDSVRSLKYCRTWMFGVDMLKDFEKDVELCMNAVCVLYRQQISASESAVGSSGGLGHFNAMSGRVLAEYLIDGDAKLRLRKSADGVKQQRPDVLDQCRKLAKDYWMKLFSIYCSGEDPFFKSI